MKKNVIILLMAAALLALIITPANAVITPMGDLWYGFMDEYNSIRFCNCWPHLQTGSCGCLWTAPQPPY